MAEPSAGPAGGLFRKLSPKARRYAAVVGIAMVLALIVLLGRRNAAEPPPADTVPTDAAGDLGEPIPLGDPPFQPQSTFADNGEAAGVLSSAITEGLSEVGASLDAEAQNFADLTDQLGAPASAPGPLAAVGKPKGQAAALAKQKATIAAQKKRIGQLQKKGAKKKPAPKKPAGGGGKPAPKKKKK